MTRTLRALLVCTIAAFVLPASGDAQIKGLLKKKVTSGLKGDGQADNVKAATKAGPTFGDGLLEITAAVGEDLQAALRLELERRNEFRKELAAYKTPEAYDDCKRQVESSPEAQKIMMAHLGNVPEGASSEEMQRVVQKMEEEKNAMVKRKCGANIDEEWPGAKRDARVAAIEREAGSRFEEANAYALLKERVPPFCKAYEAGEITIEPGKPVSIPGWGKGNYWVYSAEEAEFLAKNCKELMALLEALI